MTVNFYKQDNLTLHQQVIISNLVVQRMALLIGEKYSAYIRRVIFCPGLESCKTGKKYVLLEKGTLVQFNSIDKQELSVDILMASKILSDILTPGCGQAVFDELILKIRNTIQEEAWKIS